MLKVVKGRDMQERQGRSIAIKIFIQQIEPYASFTEQKKQRIKTRLAI